MVDGTSFPYSSFPNGLHKSVRHLQQLYLPAHRCVFRAISRFAGAECELRTVNWAPATECSGREFTQKERWHSVRRALRFEEPLLHCFALRMQCVVRSRGELCVRSNCSFSFSLTHAHVHAHPPNARTRALLSRRLLCDLSLRPSRLRTLMLRYEYCQVSILVVQTAHFAVLVAYSYVLLHSTWVHFSYKNVLVLVTYE